MNSKFVLFVIIYMKKIPNSDWLRAVQFRCNTGANYTSGFWIMIGWKAIGNFLSQWHHVKWLLNFLRKLSKMFSRVRENGSNKSRTVNSSHWWYLDRQFKDKQYPLSIVKDWEFHSSRQALEGKAKLLGKRPNKARNLTKEEE